MSYLQFDETTGSIISIGNELHTDKLCIPISKDLATAFITGKEQLSKWKVFPDKTESQKYNIVKIEKNTNEEYTDNTIYPVPKLVQDNTNVFKIIQDKGKWSGQAFLDETKKNFYITRSDYFGHQKKFYITEKNDKRYLIDSFTVDFENFFTNEKFTIDCNVDVECDLYVASGNDKFVHVEIK